MACAGDVPTLETLAAADLLRQHFPDIKVRMVNVMDLMTLQPSSEHPHGLSDSEFDSMFTTDKPVMFAYHGYPWLIHRLTYRRHGHPNFHVRGYKEEGTTTTPFDMTVLNSLDRYHLAADAVEQLITRLWRGKSPVLRSSDDIDMVGHRIVHGGRQYEEPVRITPAVKAGITGVSAFAPLHNRGELEVIDVIEKLLGDIPQVAVFDTGFHRSIPPAAAVYPGPYEWFSTGIRRYGFHGINHQYCAGRAARLLKRDLKTLRLVICHLGNGCSLAAIRAGQSIDTTMGFTPLEGLMMGTRSGSIDPGILTYLLRRGRLQPEEIDDLLNRKSGLLGISGLSSDMRDVLAAIKQGHSRARLAFDIYIHRLRAGIGAMAAALGGMDALVFKIGRASCRERGK